jgi:hypothetical protein
VQNRIFEDDVRLERVVKTGAGISVVTSQPAIKGRAAQPEEIDATMASLGFEKLAPGIYHHPDKGLIVHDLHPRNAVFRENRAVPIDAALQRAKPEFANFVRRNANLFGE